VPEKDARMRRRGGKIEEETGLYRGPTKTNSEIFSHTQKEGTPLRPGGGKIERGRGAGRQNRGIKSSGEY